MQMIFFGGEGKNNDNKSIVNRVLLYYIKFYVRMLS